MNPQLFAVNEMRSGAVTRIQDARAMERRRAIRREINVPALIKLENGGEIVCRLKNLSSTGALIELHSASDLPETFVLCHGVTGAEFGCAVRRRDGHFYGVSFETIGGRASQA